MRRSVLTLTLALSGCGYDRVSGEAMGTSYLIEADCPGPLPGQQAEAELTRITRLMSTYDPNSELSRFNREPAGSAVVVSPDVATVVAAAAEVAERTRGAFDATVAPLVALWGFGANPARELPSATEVSATNRLVGHRRIAHHLDPPRLVKLAPATLDLSGIAKGYAVDRLAGLLEDRDCRGYLVELGGEIRTRGSAPDGGPWRIGVESPIAPQLATTIVLNRGALATSGDYRQYRERDGVRFSHIIDPRTGYPVKHGLASVTVVADTAMLADAYATALLVMGEIEGRRFAQDNRLAALFLVRSDAGFETFVSDTMAGHLR